MSLIDQLKLQIRIIQIQLQILFLKQKLTVPNLPKPTKIIIHHSGAWHNFEQTNEYHKKIWGFKSSLNFFIGYQYFIDRGGVITQGRADTETGAHTKGLNNLSIGICCMGNGQEKDFTTQQYDSLFSLLERLQKKYDIPKTEIYGHRNFTSTICPSDVLYARILQYKLGKTHLT